MDSAPRDVEIDRVQRQHVADRVQELALGQTVAHESERHLRLGAEDLGEAAQLDLRAHAVSRERKRWVRRP